MKIFFCAALCVEVLCAQPTANLTIPITGADSTAIVTVLPTAATATVGRLYRWTGATTAYTCPSGGAGGSGGSATAFCITVDGATWLPVGGAGGVSSVSGASPIQSSGGSNPVISCPTCVTSGGVSFNTIPVSSAVPSPADVWMANEGSGNTFADTSGTANTVTAGGTVGWSAGPGRCSAGCAHLPGSFNSTSANHTNFNPGSSQAFSVSAWASYDALGNYEPIVTQQNTTTNTPGWNLFKNPSGGHANEMIAVLTDSAGGMILISFGVPQVAGHLYHYVMTVDGTHTAAGVHLWVDGGMESYQETILSDSLSGDMTPNSSIYLGSRSDNFMHLTGYLAGVHLYNRALTQTEVLALYAAGPTVDTFTQATRTSGSVTASSFATLDADCGTGAKLGGGTATDNTNLLQAVLITALPTAPLELVVDGCSVTTGLYVAQTGHTTIRGSGWDSGFYVKSGSNAMAISNGWGSAPTGTIPTRGQNVAITNLRLNGNRGVFPNGNSNMVDARGNPCMATLSISNIDHVLVDKVWVYDSPCLGMFFDNVGDVVIDHSRVDAPSGAINTDAIHFDGPANDLHVLHSHLQGGDDLVALNAPEGYGGDISRAVVDGIEADGSGYSAVLRLYSKAGSTAYTVKDVTLSNSVGGTTGSNGVVIFGNNSGATGADWIQNLNISNCRFYGPTFLNFVGESVGDVRVSNSQWIPTGANPAIQFQGGGISVNNISLDNFSLYRNPTGNAAGWLTTIPSGFTLNRMDLNGVSVLNSLGSSYADLSYLIDVPSGGSIGRLWVGAADPIHVTTPYSSAGDTNITHVQGPGVVPAGMTVK